VDMGKDKEHRKFTFLQDKISHIGLLFKTKRSFKIGEVVTIIYELNENHFNNRVTIQLMIQKIF